MAPDMAGTVYSFVNYLESKMINTAAEPGSEASPMRANEKHVTINESPSVKEAQPAEPRRSSRNAKAPTRLIQEMK